MPQNSMEQLLRCRIAQLHNAAPGSIGDLFQFELVSCSEAEGEYSFRCQTLPWMRNPAGTLHGGMSAAAADQAMGFLAFCLMPSEGFAPTIQMQTEYHYPLLPGKELFVKVTVTSISRSMVHLRCEISHSERKERVCVSATGIYYFQAR